MINPRDDIRVEFVSADHDLPGWPGYRTRPGRSGYDPLDYQYEYSHFQGRIVSSFLRQNWHTKNLLYLTILNLFGLFNLLTVLLVIPSILLPWLNYFPWLGWNGAAGMFFFFFTVYLVIGFGFREIDAILEAEIE